MSSLTMTLWVAFEAYVRAIWSTTIMTRFRGAMVALFGGAGLISFLTHNPLDASLNTVSAAPVHNAMGRFGAVISDFCLQSLGVSAWPLMVFLLIFGLQRALSTDPESSRPRIRRSSLWGLIMVLMLSATLAPIMIKTQSPIDQSLGGFWGLWIHSLAKDFFDTIGLPGAGIISSLIFAGLALHGFNQALGLRLHSYIASLNWIIKILGRSNGLAAFNDIQQNLQAQIDRLKSHHDETIKRDQIASDTSPFEALVEPSRKLDPVVKITDADIKAPSLDLKINPIDERSVEPRIFDPQPVRKAPEKETQPQFDFLRSSRFRLPDLSILTKPSIRNNACDEDQLKANARMLEAVLGEFGVRGTIDQIRPGPVVTLYELVPAAGVKHSRVVALADDIARNMSARSCRVAVVQGRNAIGIELPNATRETVWLRDLLASSEYERAGSNLPMALGETIGGEPYIADLSKMPHLLIAGTTGSGKSVGVNAMILSILYRLDPEQCKFIMIDPKMLELSVYDGIPHLLTPVVTDPKKAVVALKWTVKEMEDRYRRMSKVGVRNIASFNERARETAARGENFVRKVQTGFDEVGQPIFEIDEMVPEPMPYLVVVVDEVADLMMVAGKEIEGAVQRLAQMARAAGIHLIMATQRPSVDVITGTIKANFPTRISFQVTSKIDSRTILGEQGAEQLLGQGDMLYMAGGGRITRLHGPYCSDQEVEAVAQHLRAQGAPTYLDDVTYAADEDGDDGSGMASTGDELYDKAVYFVTIERKASTSFIQRKLGIGYNRAASIMEKMETEGVVGPANHVGKRDILVGPPAGL
jgi:DNA segregation ATPase FtsK/SpoIIIE, S-DNA-T family